MFVGVHIKDIKCELRDLLLFQRLNHQRLRIDLGVRTSSISGLEDCTTSRLRTNLVKSVVACEQILFLSVARRAFLARETRALRPAERSLLGVWH